MSVQLSSLISDGMVLQRNASVKLWGKADEPVKVTFMGNQYHALPDEEQCWEIILSDLEPGGPFTMTINEIALQNVYVGDVWLCAGQSNMQISMQRVRHCYPEEMNAVNPHVRQFVVPLQYSFKSPLDTIEGGSWSGAAPETIESFSAIGYFFAKRLYERYQVPIGLVVSAMGGTPIHAWIGRDALESYPELLEEADRWCDDAYISRIQEADARNAESFYGEVDDKDPGLSEKWYAVDYDDSGWQERPLLEPWPENGSVWLRKTLIIPPELEGKPATLFLGTVVDWDTAYVNGQIVGSTPYRYPPREYRIPALPKGRCVITLRVISKNGGAFTPGKQYLLTTEAGSFNLNSQWRFCPGVAGPSLTPEVFLHSKPTGLYHGMIAPLKRFTLKGILWYQGESDDLQPLEYAHKFEALVRQWRKDWGYELPFIFVELPHWGGEEHWSLLRQQQWLGLQIPNTAMAAAYDLGEHNDLHPQGKQPVGDRLARCAMRVAYGDKLPHSPFEIIGFK